MGAQVIRSIAELRNTLDWARRAGARIGFVPTMGALHAGHARLIETAAAGSDVVVVSIFVNPIQFNLKEDYDRYPRDFAADVALCERLGVAIVFAPALDEMYPRPQLAVADVKKLTDHLCGHFRPGHFQGVATVVLKLFHIVQPDRAFFGEKDAQQLAVIRRMVSDLNLPVTIVGVPTVREEDGLAISSRNQLLTAGERRVAPLLYQALRLAEDRIAAGARVSAEIKQEASQALRNHPSLQVEYFEIVDAEELQPVDRITGPVLVAGAIWIGATRLIDNVRCSAS